MIFKKLGLLITIIVFTIMFAVGGYSIYYGVVDYYETVSKKNITEALISIENGDYSRAQGFLHASYEQGDKKSLEYLTWLEISRGNYEKALIYARDATRFRLPSAYEVMGDLAILGYGNAKGVNAAISYFLQGVSLNEDPNADKRQLVGDMIDRALPLCSTAEEELNLIHEGLKYNSKLSYLAMGDKLFLGEGTGINFETAIEMWNTALSLGVKDAKVRLAGCYFYGFGVKQNVEKAIQLYQEAADERIPEALYSLGLINLRLNPNNFDNIETAKEYFRQAAILKYPQGASALAILEMSDKRRSFYDNIEAAKEWFDISYKTGGEVGSIIYALTVASTGDQQSYDEAIAIIYDLSIAGSYSAKALINELAKRTDPRKILSQVIGVSYKLLTGEVAFSQTAPEVYALYHGTDPEALSKYINKDIDYKVVASLGNNFPQVVENPKTYTYDGNLLIIPGVDNVFVDLMPTTGAHRFMSHPPIPKPLPPKTPDYYNNGQPLNLLIGFNRF